MKMNISLYRLVAAVTLLFAAISANAVETAAQLIARCAAAVNDAPSIEARVTVSSGGNSTDISMTIARQKFAMDTPAMRLWYDGTTQWTYTTDSHELSITEPTVDELLECNPFAILNYYSRAYTVRRLEEDGLQLELAAKSRSASIRKAVVTVDPATNFPSKIVITLSNGRTMVATVKSITRGKTLRPSVFVWDKTKYPAATTTDLR